MAPEIRQRAPRSPLLVELAGPAGAGKSTLALALCETGPTTVLGLEASRARMVARVLRMAPALAWARVTGAGRWWSRDELRGLGYLGAWEIPTRRDVELVVVDHGPVFRLASLIGNGPPMTRTTAFVRLWRQLARRWSRTLDAVILLDAPDSLLLDRITGRAQPHRIRGASVAEAEPFLAQARAGFDQALQEITRGPVRLVRLDTSANSPQALAAKVREALASVDRPPR